MFISDEIHQKKFYSIKRLKYLNIYNNLETDYKNYENRKEKNNEISTYNILKF